MSSTHSTSSISMSPLLASMVAVKREEQRLFNRADGVSSEIGRIYCFTRDKNDFNHYCDGNLEPDDDEFYFKDPFIRSLGSPATKEERDVEEEEDNRDTLPSDFAFASLFSSSRYPGCKDSDEDEDVLEQIFILTGEGEKGKKWQALSSFSNEKQLYEWANIASYGDVMRSCTRVDETVRKGRDLSTEHFKVGADLLKKLQELWTLKMGRAVVVKPYKINVYQCGDFFLPHSDSPDEDGLIGTILVDVSRKPDNAFHFCSQQGSTVVHKWNALANNVCMFYADVKHCVDPVKKDYRVTVAFKVYSNKLKRAPLPATYKWLVDELSTKTASFNSGDKFGILLRYGYNYSTNDVGALKGDDATLAEVLIDVLKWNVEFISVLVKEYHTIDCSNSSSCYDRELPFYTNFSVCWVCEEVIDKYPPSDYIKQMDVLYKQKGLTKLIPFLLLDRGYRWSYAVNTNAFIGNQHGGVSRHATYLNKALIVTLQQSYFIKKIK